MRKIYWSLFILSACLLQNRQALSQAAGNWMYNQSLDYNAAKSYGGLNNANEAAASYRNPYQQTYSYAINPNDTVIEIESRILMNVKADSYLAIFGVSQVGDSIENCHQLINNRINKFIKNIAKLGIKESDIYIDFISQMPIYEVEVEKKLFSKSYNEIPRGFELNKNVHIYYKDRKIVDALLIEAAKCEIYDIVKVDYFINDIEGVYDSLRVTATKLLNKKVKEFSKLNVKFIPLYQTVNEDITSLYPLDKYCSYTRFNAPTLLQVKGGSSSYPLSSRTNQYGLYYNKESYASYDMVINPTVIEPVVQFSYTLKMRYVLKKQ